MGKRYAQLQACERLVIDRLNSDGRSLREIGRTLARAPSTISRELKRNGRATKVWFSGYDPARAQGLAERRQRRPLGHKLARQPALWAVVRDHLAMGRSPEQIAGRLTLEQARTVISHESIYRYIYHQVAQKNWLHRYLRRAKSRRGRLGKRGGSPASLMKHRRPLTERPAAAADRRQSGHWEADLMLFRQSSDILLIVHERTSRLTKIIRQPNRSAATTRDSLARLFDAMPANLRRTLTIDNGTENALHYELPMATFFCDVRAPWQKGGIENAIGRLRRFLPRRTKLDELDHGAIEKINRTYNETPRKCLGYRTPNEVFSDIIKRVALET